FKAHWTGYRLMYPNPTLVLVARQTGGEFWSEGYISTSQPSWVLCFRKNPHKTRGSGGERPEDKVTSSQALEIARSTRQSWVEQGLAPDEEVIRYEDFDSPIEAVDEFFNYHDFYCLRAVDGVWADYNYRPAPSVGWDEGRISIAAMPVDAAIDEGLKKADILWITPDNGTRPVPCWYLYTKDKRLFVLSGEPEQTIPGATQLRSVQVGLRRKGRDAMLAEFDAEVRIIDARNRAEFEEVAALLLAKRQSVRGTTKENIDRWLREGVILELIPRS
ncbi:MAG: hypothetical protein ACRDIA_02970, partial [Actinomycetota bacterium]